MTRILAPSMNRNSPPAFMGHAVRRGYRLPCVVSLLLACSGCSSVEQQEPLEPRLSTQPLDRGDAAASIVAEAGADRFPLATSGRSVPIFVEADAYAGVIRVAGLLAADIEKVVGSRPELLKGERPNSGSCVFVGTLGRSALVDELVAAGKLDVSRIRGQWEATLIETVESPWPGVERALVVVGSDKRGTLYGMLDLSTRMGVSPWYYWADVPVPKHPDLHVTKGARTLGSPAIKYRGIFINDENPALSGWAAQFGGFKSQFYEKLFELMLRLRANYLWPAMWGKAFNVDDPKSPELADEYGIVMGTSHHEPMMRNEKEWTLGKSAWNYSTHQAQLEEFWAGGIRRMDQRESLVTIGMRGAGDEAMSPNPDIPLLRTIIDAQRRILEDVTGRSAASTPQVWTIYKEVQDYWDQGLRAPDDVTVIFADDNFGNIRKLPVPGEPRHSGGFGVYYHFDYVGAPRNYKWLNTNLIPRVWEQMHLAYEYGVDRLWLVNVGDLKLLEFPTQFFLDYAWDPKAISVEGLQDYARAFAARQFGDEHASAIAEILTKYSKFNARRKPELLSPSTYSLINFREADRIVSEYAQLAAQAEALSLVLPAEYADAFHQLVLYPVKACANLNDLYVTVGRNRLYANQGRVATNDLATRAEQLFARDAELSKYYNRTMANGKWNHIADQTHIGYTTWQEPSSNQMPQVKRLTLPDEAEMGIAVEGSEQSLPGEGVELRLPVSSPRQFQAARYVEVYNRGLRPFDFRVEAGAPYVSVTPSSGTVSNETRLWVSVDWNRAPRGASEVPITIFGPNATSHSVLARLDNAEVQPEATARPLDPNGYVAMEAEQYSRKVETDTIRWQVIADLSRTASGITPFPVTAPAQTPSELSPRLEYDLHLDEATPVHVEVQVAPTGQLVRTGLKYAVSFDDQVPQSINLHGDQSDGTWQDRVSNNVNTSLTTHKLASAGTHVLKLWMIDPAVVFQKVIVDTTRPPASYLGPPTARFEEPEPQLFPLAVAAVAGAAGAAGAEGVAGSATTTRPGSDPGSQRPIEGTTLEGGACSLRPASPRSASSTAAIATAGLLLLVGTRRRRDRRVR